MRVCRCRGECSAACSSAPPRFGGQHGVGVEERLLIDVDRGEAGLDPPGTHWSVPKGMMTMPSTCRRTMARATLRSAHRVSQAWSVRPCRARWRRHPCAADRRGTGPPVLQHQPQRGRLASMAEVGGGRGPAVVQWRRSALYFIDQVHRTPASWLTTRRYGLDADSGECGQITHRGPATLGAAPTPLSDNVVCNVLHHSRTIWHRSA